MLSHVVINSVNLLSYTVQYLHLDDLLELKYMQILLNESQYLLCEV